jgi:hypothetical protein
LHENYLHSISREVWKVVCDGVAFLDDNDQPTPDQLQKIHRNAQAISILTSSINMEEFNRVDVWMWPRMFGQHFGWPMKDPSL